MMFFLADLPGFVIEMKAVVKSDFTDILKSATGKLMPAPVCMLISQQMDMGSDYQTNHAYNTSHEDADTSKHAEP